MEAAQGTLAPRAYEQLAILVLLLEDSDAEIRATADETLTRIPEGALKAFLARSDVPIGLREFFADRGIFPDEMPEIKVSIDVDDPLLDTSNVEGDDAALFGDESEDRETAQQRLQKMSFTERLRAAVKGTREMRAILIRDTNKMIAAAVLSSPKLAEPEVEAFAKMGSVSDDVLRTISQNRAWMKNYKIALSLAKNPKTPGPQVVALHEGADGSRPGDAVGRPQGARAAPRRRAQENRRQAVGQEDRLMVDWREGRTRGSAPTPFHRRGRPTCRPRAALA